MGPYLGKNASNPGAQILVCRERLLLESDEVRPPLPQALFLASLRQPHWGVGGDCYLIWVRAHDVSVGREAFNDSIWYASHSLVPSIVKCVAVFYFGLFVQGIGPAG